MGDIGEAVQDVKTSTWDRVVAPEHSAPLAGLAGMALGVPGAVGTAAAGVGGSVVGAAAAGAAQAGMMGQNPWSGAVMAGAGQALGGMGGDLGDFWNSDYGKAALAEAIGGGNPDGMLEAFGLKGSQKDVVEEILAIMAIAAISNKYAKEALNKAKELESYEFAAIKSAITQAEGLMPTDASEEAQVQVQLENVAKEYGRAREAVQHDMATRGLGASGYGRGQDRRMKIEESGDKLQARRDIELSRPDRTSAALQAKASLLNPLGFAADRARSAAEARLQAPMDLASNMYLARQKTAEDRWYEANMPGRQRPGAPEQPGGIEGAIFDAYNTGKKEEIPTIYDPGTASWTNPTEWGNIQPKPDFDTGFTEGWSNMYPRANQKPKPITPATPFGTPYGFGSYGSPRG